MSQKIITTVISHDLDFLIHFQGDIIKVCKGIDPQMISAMQDILHILEATREIGFITELPNKES